MRKLVWLIVLNLFLSSAYAYEMHGTLNDNNDGTFEANIVSSTGHNYWGYAQMQGDGTLAINVAIQGVGSEVYLGTAKLNNNGGYDMVLKNNTTGESATGTLEKSS